MTGGWLSVEWEGPGRTRAKHYAVTAPEEKRNHSSSLGKEKSGTTVPLSDGKSGTTVPVKSGTTVPPNTIQGTLLTPDVVVVGHRVPGPDNDHDDVFEQVVSLFNACEGKQNLCNTPGLRRAARRAYDKYVSEITTPTAAWRGSSRENATELVRQIVVNYVEAWVAYPKADRDCGLSTLLSKPAIRQTYEPGWFSMAAIHFSATRPDRPRSQNSR